MSLEDRPVEQPHAAGVDIGAREIFVAVPHDPEGQPLRCDYGSHGIDRRILDPAV